MKYLVLVACLCVAACSPKPSQPSGAATCNLSAPPPGAVNVPLGAHDMFYFPDPRNLPSNFTGCITVWWSAERVRVEETQYENGKPKAWRLGNGGNWCEYEGSRAVNKAKQEFCPAADKIEISDYPWRD